MRFVKALQLAVDSRIPNLIRDLESKFQVLLNRPMAIERLRAAVCGEMDDEFPASW